ncbi:unnamed protein product [Arctia plantaginis]|uniref:Elongation of very long chain fatty acids protein n=1 Tax=Arctia plantaginis TaxID=874455 RepID=A0A8S1AEC4_ARCPL|nr:unnamed protein product [Arctia plantaginis]
MALLLKKAWHGYVYLFEEAVDQQTKSWPLVTKPYQGITLLALYLLFVLKWGPQWMQSRRPLNLDKAMIVYNAFQVMACLYLFVEALRLGWLRDYKWLCEPVDFSNSAKATEIKKIIYMFFMLKISDLLDTIFFVLRKKNNQVSFLHVYHHAGMVMIAWATITYLPGGHGTLVGVINCFVHVVMYSYYLLTVAMPSIRNMVWIKKFVTQIQLVQFLWCAIHFALIVFKSDCEYPRWSSAVILPQNLFMLVLFSDFYYKTYIKKPKNNPYGKVQSNGAKNGSINQDKINDEISKINNEKDRVNEVRKRISNNDSNYNNSKFDANDNVCKKDKNENASANGKTKTNGHHK